MKVNIKGLINRLDCLRERLNDLFDNLDSLEELEQEDIEIETVQQYFQNDDTFNLSIALDVLEQADKLDRALEIIREKKVYPSFLLNTKNLEEYNYEVKQKLTQEEYDLLKEILE